MGKLKLTISCDDVNPLQNYRILGTKTETWFRKLNEDFGVKFDLFLPSNYHNLAPISKHKDWIKELSSIDWISLNAHGHYHMTSDPQRFGECEFFELQDVDEARERLDLCYNEWMGSIGEFPQGWRNPGWLCSPQAHRAIQYMPIKYVAAHYEHNRGLEWGCKTFFGHDGIQVTNIAVHNEDMIMYQSHIAGAHNHNVWNRDNFEQLHLSLTHLFDSVDVTPKFLKECLTQ